MQIYSGLEEPFRKVVFERLRMGWVMWRWRSKPLFARSVRTLPGGAAAHNLDRLVPWLEQDRLHAGCTPRGPQTRARRNVARGVEVQRGTPPLRRHRAAAARRSRSMSQFS